MGRNERKSAKDHSADRGDTSLRRKSQDRSRDRHERKRHHSPSASRRHGSTDVRHHPEQTPVNHPRRAVILITMTIHSLPIAVNVENRQSEGESIHVSIDIGAVDHLQAVPDEIGQMNVISL